MKNKSGFTLVELLAVIAILAILVIIALPNVINMYNKAQKETFLTEAKKVYTEAEKKYISSSINGNTVKVINSKDSSKLDMTGEKLQYCIILNNSGKVTDIKVSNGKWIASLDGDKSVDELTIDDLADGNLDDYECGSKKPKKFSEDSWKTIAEAVRSGNDGVYNVGDIKKVDLGDLGKYNVRIANKSTPSECSTEGFSQTACGFVIEFEGVITNYKMNSTDTNLGGWKDSNMRSFINNEIYNSLPSDLKNEIITTKVISSHGITETNNFITNDKLYLLSAKEVYKVYETTLANDSTYNSSRLLDGYKTAYVPYKTIFWWLRDAESSMDDVFTGVGTSGELSPVGASNEGGVSPAFRIV